MKPAIEFDHVRKVYDGRAVVDDLTLAIAPGELFVLVGESGSGKTTSLKMVNCLIQPDSGTVFFKGTDVAEMAVRPLRLSIGYVLQQIALFPRMTVAQNIAVIPEMTDMPKATLSQHIDALLESVGLDPKTYRNRMPAELSGGEKQRVGIVRALSGRPSVILMDEPFSALDPLSRVQLQDLVLQLHSQWGMTILFVTHDVNEALKLGDRIGVLRRGQLQQVGTPSDVLEHPANDFVAEFFAGVRRVWLDSPLSALAGYGTAVAAAPTHRVNNRDVFAGDASLRQILSPLATAATITVLDAEHHFTLSQAQVWRFLAEHAGGDATLPRDSAS